MKIAETLFHRKSVALARRASSALVLSVLCLVGLVAQAQTLETCYPYVATVSSGESDLKGFSAEEVCQRLIGRQNKYVNSGSAYRYVTYNGLVPASSTAWYCGSYIRTVDVATGQEIPSETGPWNWDGVVVGACPGQSDGSCGVGNPTLPGHGIKVERSTDYQGAGAHALDFERFYRSRVIAANGAEASAQRWHHTFSAKLELTLDASAGGAGHLLARRPDGDAITFSRVGVGQWRAFTGTRDTLTETADAAGTVTGYRYRVFDDDATETYDTSGTLLSITERNGWVTTLTYSTSTTPASVAPRPGLLISVRNHFGRELRFTYDAQGRMAELLPPGAVSGTAAGSASSPVRYGYDEAAGLGASVPALGQLTSVTWQDGFVRRYHYEDIRWPHALTGITDEAGVRYATYAYGADGRVLRSEHVGGVDRVEFGYGSGETAVTTYANGQASTSLLSFTDVAGRRVVSSVSAPCSLCGNTQQSSSYDAQGKPTRTIAHDGAVTFFAYDAKGRETERATFASSFQGATTRPALSNATSVVSTRWHATFNLPTQIAEPGKITVNAYNAKGMLTSQSWSATTDATGAAKFNAAKTGSTFATTWGYNANSLATTVIEKVDGVTAAQMTYTVNAAGNATKATNPRTGQATSSATYDAHGRLVREVDSFGTITRSYSPRGFVLSETDEVASSTITHNAIGLVTGMDSGTGYVYSWTLGAAHTIDALSINGVQVPRQVLVLRAFRRPAGVALPAPRQVRRGNSAGVFSSRRARRPTPPMRKRRSVILARIRARRRIGRRMATSTPGIGRAKRGRRFDRIPMAEALRNTILHSSLTAPSSRLGSLTCGAGERSSRTDRTRQSRSFVLA